MSDNKKGSQDLTRIEDLSDFIHGEDEDISLEGSDSESSSMLDMEKDSFGDATSFIQVPEELSNDDLTTPVSLDDLDEDTSEFSSSFDNEIDSDDVSFDQNSFEEESSFDDENTSFEEDQSNFDDQEPNFEDATDFNEETSDFTTDSEISFDDYTTDFDNDNFTESNFEETESNFEEFNDDLDSSNDLNKDEDEELINTEPVEEEIESVQETVAAPPIPAPKDFKEPESLADVKEFAEVITATDLSIEGNPPFSIVLSKVKYQEDALEILETLKEFKIISNDKESDARASLERGKILIPRLSEYAAIILCHKLRRFDLNIKMGLSQEIHETSTFESSDKGLISKKSILSNKKMSESLKLDDVKLEDIQVSTLNSFEGHTVLKSLGVQSKSKSVSNEELTSELFDTTYTTTSDELIRELKQIAITQKANGLLSVTTTLLNNPIEGVTNFICTANIVIVSQS